MKDICFQDSLFRFFHLQDVKMVFRFFIKSIEDVFRLETINELGDPVRVTNNVGNH